MEEGGGVTGTVTSLSSLFPPVEAHKAAKRVEDAISDKREEMERVNEFIADNASLINLVQKLPEELHHDIMVPFGKAAFFPGRLIHTNEFMVLLGEGYYAERTSKQTVEILGRRGKALDAHVESLRSMIEDLKAEAMFFDRTALEVEEGLIEIREEIPEESVSSEKGSVEQGLQSISLAQNAEASDKDDEYARLMARLDELEKEEQAAEAMERNDEDTDNHDFDVVKDQSFSREKLKSEKPHLSKTPSWSIGGYSKHGSSLYQNQREPDIHEQLNHRDLTSRLLPEEKDGRGNNPSHSLQSSIDQEQCLIPKETTTAVTLSNDQVSSRPTEWRADTQRRADTSKAFTGSVIERVPNFQMDRGDHSMTSSQVPSSQPSKPVSRFKLQRR